MTGESYAQPDNVSPRQAPGNLLALRLREEAAATRPAFSPELHQRLVCALREQRASCRTVTVPKMSAFSHQRLGVLAAVAGVACLILIGIFGWRTDRQSPSATSPQVASPAIAARDLLADVLLAISLPTQMAVYVDETLSDVWNIPPAARWRDNTRQAAFTLLARLPVDVEPRAEQPQVEQ